MKHNNYKNNNLFSPIQLSEKLKQYDFPQEIVAKSQEIFSRWNNFLLSGKQGEKQLQADFLNEIFGDVLGYSHKRDDVSIEINLEKEEKTELDAQKPDGILGFFTSVSKDCRVIIELKDQKNNLDKKQNRDKDNRTPVEQAFGYVSKYQGVEFVIVSNFKEIRLYKANYQGSYHSFLIQDLAEDLAKQKEFYFLLAKDRLFTKSRDQSPTQNINQTNNFEEIEKRFYAHYKALRQEIWDNLVALNKDKKFGINFYLYKAQKLIDRTIFIRFCYENGALDSDVVYSALQNHPLVKGKYQKLKKLFSAMNEGNSEMGIAEFNGGLFAPDKELDSLNISDEVIDKIINLYKHDFGSDLDINILGHIFEQSISDLEELSGEIERKRKKDGVFYTPNYVTEFIVEEAIGGWLRDRKAEIEAKENSEEFWLEYSKHLKSIKVLDPSCGSGAFLVEVFSYLQKQWEELKNHIKIDYNYKEILQNNIFGVDINPASIGITKLSLWLKTAKYREKLTTLDDNIKIGNSLIDDKDYAGYYHEFEGKIVQEVLNNEKYNLFNPEELKKDKKDIDEKFKKSLAFRWKDQFPQIFNKFSSGFDVVVGNPPYVDSETMTKYSQDDRIYISNKYKSCKGNWDLYIPFYERALNLTKDKAKIYLITPNKWLSIKYGEALRKLLFDYIETLADASKVKVFQDVSVFPVIVGLDKQKSKQIQTAILEKDFLFKKLEIINKSKIDDNFGIILGSNFDLLSKFRSIPTTLSNFCDVLNPCTVSEAYLIKDQLIDSKQKALNSDEYFQFINTGTVEPFVSRFGLQKTTYIKSQYQYPCLSKKWLKENMPRRFAQANAKKLIFSGIGYFEVLYDFGSIAGKSTIIATNFKISQLALCSVLNSKLVDFYLDGTYKTQGMSGGDISYNVANISTIPMPKISKKYEKIFTKLSEQMIYLHSKANELSSDFLQLLSANLGLQKTTKKLEKWYDLGVNEFFAEIAKQNKNLELDKQSKWIKYFEEKKLEALEIQSKITKTDAEIDNLVYELYDLSDEEINIIEQSV